MWNKIITRLKQHSKLLVGKGAAYGLLLPVWISLLFGRISTIGYKPTQQVIRDGNVILIANHPSLIETIVLPAMLSPWRWNIKQSPYSIADSQLFGSGRAWLYSSFRCIAVHRNAATGSAAINQRAIRSTLQILRNNGVIIAYPEGGRTCKGTSWHTYQNKKVRSCNVNILTIAHRTNTTVIPVWIEHGLVTQPESLLYGYYKLFFCKKMTITFGTPLSSHQLHTCSGDTVAHTLLHTTSN